MEIKITPEILDMYLHGKISVDFEKLLVKGNCAT